jgi:hypothetical protein
VRRAAGVGPSARAGRRPARSSPGRSASSRFARSSGACSACRRWPSARWLRNPSAVGAATGGTRRRGSPDNRSGGLDDPARLVTRRLRGGRDPVSAVGLLDLPGLGQRGQRGRHRGPREAGLGGDLAGCQRLTIGERGEDRRLGRAANDAAVGLRVRGGGLPCPRWPDRTKDEPAPTPARTRRRPPGSRACRRARERPLQRLRHPRRMACSRSTRRYAWSAFRRDTLSATTYDATRFRYISMEEPALGCLRAVTSTEDESPTQALGSSVRVNATTAAVASRLGATGGRGDLSERFVERASSILGREPPGAPPARGVPPACLPTAPMEAHAHEYVQLVASGAEWTYRPAVFATRQHYVHRRTEAT